MSRPLIGITKPLGNGKITYVLTLICVWLAGGRGVVLTSSKPKYDLKINGLILSGGKDINPTYYNGKEIKPLYPYDIARDELEFEWFNKAQSDDLPILGICRGAQLINIARKGTLHFDISKAYEKASYPSGLWAKLFFRKPINVKESSLLHSILKTQKTRVNSSHTQSIDQLGENLVITSMEENFVVQSIEDPHKRFLLGVQFHPEYLLYSKIFRNIFKQFIIAVKEKSSTTFR